MTVYIVMGGIDYEFDTVLAVFDSYDKARTFIETECGSITYSPGEPCLPYGGEGWRGRYHNDYDSYNIQKKEVQ